MTGYVTDARGAQWALPVPLAWRMEHTAGTPCDSFWLTCSWDGGQSAQPGLSVKTLAKQELELPTLETQNKIVSILASLDDKIGLNQRINENLAA